MSKCNDLNTIFARNLRRIRESKGVSQEELAVMAGLHRTFISQIERGRRNSTLDTVQKIALTLNVGVEELFANEE